MERTSKSSLKSSMKKSIKISEKEMLDALNRSGYLLEAEISRILAEAGFFIETNQVIDDPITGKSREIDLIAEYFNYDEALSSFNVAANVYYVFEIKNNLFPVILLTQFEFTPRIEDWTGLKEALTVPEGLIYEDWHEGFYEYLIRSKKPPIYTQYCSFQKKKENDKLMALHPDNIHSGLAKITQYCEEMVKMYDTDLIYENPNKDKYFRHFLFLPILLINDDLYELKKDGLERVDSSILVYNYHYDKDPKMAYIFVVTKKGFPIFMKSMMELEDKVERRMIEIVKAKGPQTDVKEKRGRRNRKHA